MTSRRTLLQALGAAAVVPASAGTDPAPHADDCVFCRIVAGASEATVVWRDERCLAIADRYPFAPGHTLLMPRAHVQDLYAMPDALAAHLFGVAPRLARALKRVFGADGMTLVQNNERAGGQSVFHFHLHLVPRTTGVELFRRVVERPEAPRELRERQFAPVRAALAG
ncbi:MAG TPA: HIT family protein [Pseudomonadota bacterium]|nr:HIT family protein [Xanthomonadales bacterium]HQW65047.1 HIT family protein [Pseudomonadota bacterium]